MTSSETAQQILDRLEAPIVELRFLLARGYRRAHALRCVGEHHQLASPDRNVLERVVVPVDEAARRRAKLVEGADLLGRDVVVDGYNVLIGLECLLEGAPLFLADDGVVRDIAARRGIRRPGRVVADGFIPLCETLVGFGVTRIEVVLDEQVSRSGDLAAACRAALEGRGIDGEILTAMRADRAVIEAGLKAVVCSSDRVIIDAAANVFDAVRAFAEARTIIGRPP